MTPVITESTIPLRSARIGLRNRSIQEVSVPANWATSCTVLPDRNSAWISFGVRTLRTGFLRAGASPAAPSAGISGSGTTSSMPTGGASPKPPSAWRR